MLASKQINICFIDKTESNYNRIYNCLSVIYRENYYFFIKDEITEFKKSFEFIGKWILLLKFI